MATLVNVTIDCNEAQSLARFWAQVLDSYVIDPEGPTLKSASGPTIYFQRVPEAKTVKNRVHLDVAASDIPAEAKRLAALGASIVREVEEGGYAWTVMRDPEGNEFCVTQG